MAARIIIIHEKAENSFRKKAAWYYIHRGTDFVVSFTKDLWNTYETLAQMPSVGQIKKTTTTRIYAEFVSHPQVVAQYWYNSEELHILNLRYTRMMSISSHT